MARKYALGIDFGTESGRVLLVDTTDGSEAASLVYPYRHGVIDERLPESGQRLDPDWALQDPEDYLDIFKIAVPAILKKSGISADEIVGIGVDFTACTILPVKADGTPLCRLPKFRSQPHAWVKLWKHHAAQPEATRITEVARELNENWLERYGGKISSEWFFSKTLQILNDAPDIYDAADRIIEASDWAVWQLIGKEIRNSCAAGYKGLWSKKEGFPENRYFAALDPRMEHVVDQKMIRDISPLGRKAGELSTQAAVWTGLRAGTAVAVPVIDAHAAVPAATVCEAGRMVMIMGTSTCHMVLDNQDRLVPGISGSVEDGIIPGLFGYEAGQACVGDHFAWFVENCVPGGYERQAKEEGISIYQLLEEKAAGQKPGESGLLALDWWNGNRSVLVDAELSGALIGATLATRPEEIYRALIEATAFGTRVIIEAFEQHGVQVNELVACGGLPEKNHLLMQIYADVTGREIKIAASAQTTALGAAIHGAVAAGKSAGGYDSIFEAVHAMAHLKDTVYRPILENQRVYDEIFIEYMRLHDYFGRNQNRVMKKLREIKSKALKR